MKGQKGLGSVPVCKFIVLLKSFDTSAKQKFTKETSLDEMAQQARVPAAKPDYWNSIAGPHGGRRGLTPAGSAGCLLTSTYAL